MNLDFYSMRQLQSSKKKSGTRYVDKKSSKARDETATHQAFFHSAVSLSADLPSSLSRLFFLLLIIIVVMLAMVSATINTHQQQRQQIEKQLTAQINLINALAQPSAELINPLLVGSMVFSAEPGFAEQLKQGLNSHTAVIINTNNNPFWKNVQKKDYHNGFSGVILIKPIDENLSLYIAASLPKRLIINTFVNIGFYLTLALLILFVLYTVTAQSKNKKQLHYINRAAIEIINGNMDKRIAINPKANNHYSDLSQTLNAMLNRIQFLMQELKQVNNNIAHDLKSPLNRIRSRMEVALMTTQQDSGNEQILLDSMADIDSLLKTFEALLLIGNLDSKSRNYQLEKMSLSHLIERLAELYALSADDAGHEFFSDINTEIEILGNQNLLAQAIGNILDNAIKYSPSPGKITLSLQQREGTAAIIISDKGIGISQKDRDKVFLRFVRLDDARQLPGTGLGMSLVKSILAIHNATIRLYDNNPGLRVEMIFKKLS